MNIELVVCGAHLRGLPLNHQLTDLGGTFVREDRTAPFYRLYALPGGPPFKPGLVRAAVGASIAVEVWSLPAEGFGKFVAAIPSPLGVGKLVLESGDLVIGFLCEPFALEGAEEITGLGGWRAYLHR